MLLGDLHRTEHPHGLDSSKLKDGNFNIREILKDSEDSKKSHRSFSHSIK